MNAKREFLLFLTFAVTGLGLNYAQFDLGIYSPPLSDAFSIVAAGIVSLVTVRLVFHESFFSKDDKEDEDEWNKHIKERVEEFRNKGMEE